MKFRFVLILLLSVYKLFLEFMFMPIYNYVYSYLESWTYEFNLEKWFLSNIIFVLFLFFQLFSFSLYRKVFSVLILLVNCISIIPLLSTYAFNNQVEFVHILHPLTFWLIFILTCLYYSNCDRKIIKIIQLPVLSNLKLKILFFSIILTAFIWSWAGFPIINSLDDTTEQRMLLRASSLPVILNYPFMILGGTILPYMFAYTLDKKQYIHAFLFLICGILLFFTNGMKTWLFMYFFVVGIFILTKVCRDSIKTISVFISLMFILLIFLSLLFFYFYNNPSFISQFARITLIPNTIGFKSIRFFSEVEHEFLLLRESVLRSFCESPYFGGSDFYINEGFNSSLTSSRANNGLWGDAFRNFGFIGMLVYPYIIARIFEIFEFNSRTLNLRLRIIIFFIMFWHSVNASFFPWLLTSGVFFLWLILKIDDKNEKENKYIY